MGFFRDWQLDHDKTNTGQEFIDNSDRNVAARLDYLRHPLAIDQDFYVDEMAPEEICCLPREIKFDVRTLTYGVLYYPYDTQFYPYDYDEMKTLLEDGRYYAVHNPKETMADPGTPVLQPDKIFRFEHQLHGMFDSTADEEETQTVIPMTTIEVDKIVLPDNLEELLAFDEPELADKHLDALIKQDLNEQESYKRINYHYANSNYWHCTGGQQGIEPQYLVHFYYYVDVSINGYPADKWNLTYTEQDRLRKAILNRQTQGYFISDGKEMAESLPSALFNKYQTDIEETRPPFTHWYHSRLSEKGIEQQREKTGKAEERRKQWSR